MPCKTTLRWPKEWFMSFISTVEIVGAFVNESYIEKCCPERQQYGRLNNSSGILVEEVVLHLVRVWYN